MGWLVRIGLIANVVGTLLVACSIARNRGGASQTNQKTDKQEFLASVLHVCWFRLGLALIGLGFTLQLASTS